MTTGLVASIVDDGVALLRSRTRSFSHALTESPVDDPLYQKLLGELASTAYVAKALLPQVQGLGWARGISPFQWFIGGDPLTNGLQIGGCLLLLGTSTVLVALGTTIFTRRDLGT